MNCARRRILRLILGALCLWLGIGTPIAADLPWIEPRTLNIADIAGRIPDAVLHDNIVVYTGSGGIAQFVSSARVGNYLRITVTLHTRREWVEGRWRTRATLLGQRPMYDQMGSVAPQSWLRLYDGSADRTSEVRWIAYIEPQLVLPQAGAGEYTRYAAQEQLLTTLSFEANGLRVPANWGGEVTLYGDYAVLTGVFTIPWTDDCQIDYLGAQENVFQSYIGPGWVGQFQPLMNQLRGRYPSRHSRIMLNRPAGANYIMFTYPPMPFDVYDTTQLNLQRPSGGTVRLAPDAGMLSQDMANGGAFPLEVAWQDADQSAGPYLSLLPTIDRLTPPEYVVPAGVAYNPCFLSGNCSNSVLSAIYNASMTIRVIYLRVTPTYLSPRLSRIALKMADETWQPLVNEGEGLSAASTEDTAAVKRLYVPLAAGIKLPSQHPVGLFTADGRMVGYAP